MRQSVANNQSIIYFSWRLSPVKEIFQNFLQSVLKKSSSNIIVSETSPVSRPLFQRNPLVLNEIKRSAPFYSNGIECFNECFKLLTTCGRCAGDIYHCTTGPECFKMLSRPCFRCIGIATNQCLGCTYDSYECVEACKNSSKELSSMEFYQQRHVNNWIIIAVVVVDVVVVEFLTVIACCCDY